MRRSHVVIAATVVAAGAFGTEYALGAHADAIPAQVRHLVTTAAGVPSAPRTSTTPAAPASSAPSSTPVTVTTAASPTSSVTTTGAGVRFSRGSTGADVMLLQQRLARLGLLQAQPNGFYGPATASGVARFQTNHGLAQVPGVDQATWDAIATAAAAAPKPSVAATTAPATAGSAAPAPSTSPSTSKAAATGTTGARTPSAPTLDSRCLTGRVLCVNTNRLRLYWVVDGQVQDSWSIRVGMPTHPTRHGQFSVFRMEKNSWSNLYHVNMPYSMYFSGGEAVHYSAQFANTGYGDGSHGCVNLRDYNGIAWLYSQVHLGDTVVVY